MKIKKKTIIITAAGLTALGVGGWYLAQNFRSSQVDVYPVSELSQSIWQSGTSLEGTIASQVSQEVHLQDKQIVSAVHVQEGQEVKKGDPLLSYDMTLVNIDLEMEKLTRQQLEVKKKGLEQELEKLKKDKAQAVSHTEDYQVEFLGRNQKTDPAAEFTAADQNPELPTGENGTEEIPVKIYNNNDRMLFFGLDYGIARKEGDEWLVLNTSTVWNSVGILIQKGRDYNFKAHMYNLVNDNKPGTYKVYKRIGFDGTRKEWYMSAEFKLE